LKHFSFSQLSRNRSIAMHIVDYWCRTEKQRRADKKKYKLGYGSLTGNVAQKLIGNIYFVELRRRKLKTEIMIVYLITNINFILKKVLMTETNKSKNKLKINYMALPNKF